MPDINANSKKRFTLAEARSLLPEVSRITEEAALTIEGIVREIQALDENDPRRSELEHEYAKRVNAWAEGILALGCEVKGVFLVDFDNGQGYYCWKWPEPDVEHFHGYEEGFAGRMRIN
jgi:hypothetical protein